MSSLAEKFGPPKGETPPQGRLPANRNTRPELALHVKTRKGAQWAVPYAYFVEAFLSEDRDRLIIRFSHRRFTLTGARLQVLFDRLLDQSLGVIAEADSGFDEGASDEPFIESIKTDDAA